MDLLARPAKVELAAKEAAKERVVEKRGELTAANDFAGVDVDHRRSHLADQRREGKLDLLAIRRQPFFGRKRLARHDNSKKGGRSHEYCRNQTYSLHVSLIASGKPPFNDREQQSVLSLPDKQFWNARIDPL
ncbi:MAG TPA: hypothetical protein QF509_07410 [Rhodospirillales bacterium]|nr:hypothetical protein [Rhodospirillales bacterium]